MGPASSVTLDVVPVYAALLAVLFVVLSARVIQLRTEHKISLGVGGNAELERRTRVQANFAEYVPLALLLLALAELQGASDTLLHALCLLLLLSRLAHAWGMSRTPDDFKFRVFGVLGTLGVLLLSALLLLVA